MDKLLNDIHHTIFLKYILPEVRRRIAIRVCRISFSAILSGTIGALIECEDLRSQKINYKIRELTLQKLPYIAVVGDKEAQSGTVSVRARGGKNLGVMPIEEFIARVVSEDQSRKNTDD